MLDPESRYYDLPDRTRHGSDDREVVYKARRLLAQRDPGATWFRHEVAPADRPDLLTFRTLRDPLLFWRLCEANGVEDPFALTSTPLTRILVPPPGT